jgi:hypothetical protein
MPVQKSKNPLFQKIADKARKSHEAHKAEPVKLGGGGDLPAGIEGGVAQLVDCHFGTYATGPNKDQPFFYAAAVVVEPPEHKGSRTKIGPMPLCETKSMAGKVTPFDDHYARMLNEFKKLGVKTEEIGFDDLETVAEALQSEGPYIRFRTWQGQATEQYPNPRVNEDWRGRCEYSGNGEAASSAVVDNTGKDQPEKADEVPFGDDLDALADAANKGDADAKTKIAQRAEAAGVKEESDAADGWEDSVEIIRKAEGEGKTQGDDEPAADEKPAPVVGELYWWKSPKADGEKTKEYNARKAVEGEVIKVNERARTVQMKNLATQRPIQFKGKTADIPFDELRDTVDG